jgi:hypothetical protein
MFSFLISLLGKRAGVAFMKYLPYLLGALVLVVTAWLIYDKGYDHGVEVIERKYQTAIQEERNRQLDANREALEEARLRQAKLERLLDERNAEIQGLLLEGSEDPDADRRAISSDSVLRINQIR